MPTLESLLAAVGHELDLRLPPRACELQPGAPCKIDLGVEALGDDDRGHTLTVAGVTFWIAKPGEVAPLGAIPIDPWSAARSEAITIAVNDATNSTITVKNDDGTVHLFGPVGMAVSTDAPGIEIRPIDPGALPVCL